MSYRAQRLDELLEAVAMLSREDKSITWKKLLGEWLFVILLDSATRWSVLSAWHEVDLNTKSDSLLVWVKSRKSQYGQYIPRLDAVRKQLDPFRNKAIAHRDGDEYLPLLAELPAVAVSIQDLLNVWHEVLSKAFAQAGHEMPTFRSGAGKRAVSNAFMNVNRLAQLAAYHTSLWGRHLLNEAEWANKFIVSPSETEE